MPFSGILRGMAAVGCLVILNLQSHAQSALESERPATQEGAQSSARGGSVTAGVFPPVYDANQRPITVGGTVKSGPVIFRDIAKEAGLTVWKHEMGSADKRTIVETIGSGVALLDYDNDGWLDIYLVNGS